jgi:outer membrane lipoprotein-sorting protein
MNHEHFSTDSEELPAPLDAAILAVQEEPLPVDAIERVMFRASQLAKTSPVSVTPVPDLRPRGRKVSRVVLGGLSVAACVVAVAGVALFLDRSAGQSFAQVVEKVKAARSVRLKMITRFGHQPEMEGKMYLDDNRMRVEQFDGMLAQVADFDRKQALFLDGHRKLAQPLEMDTKAKDAFANPIDQLRRAKTSDAERIGQEVVNGRRTNVYRLRKVELLGMKGFAEMIVWTDVESDLPAKIVVRDPDPKAEVEVRFEEFVWNQPLDAQLFSLNVPEGFQRGVVVTTPRPGETKDPITAAPGAAPAFVDGVLRYRVPGQILWTQQGTTITALLRDPESVPQQEHQPHELRQWDAATGKLNWFEAVAGAGAVSGTADGTTLATVIGYEVQLREAASGKVTRKWVTNERLQPLAFSPDGKTLAAGITEWGRYGGRGGKPSGGVQFWDADNASLVRSIADDKPVTFLKYSVDGKFLATSSNEGPVKLWNAATGELIRMIPGLAGADFSPDGQTIACVSVAPSGGNTISTVELYKLADGSLLKSLTSEKGATASTVLSVTFSPDGRFLAATDWNGTVTLWDVATGNRKQTVTEQAGVHCAAFAPGGATLALGGEDRTLRLLKLPAELKRRGER